MAHKEFVRLLESNILILDRLSDRLKKNPRGDIRFPRNQMNVLVRLYLGGRARLKDIAMREMVPDPNLCATFRKLEADGLVARTVDEHDRRNTWYSCTAAGEQVALQAMDVFRKGIERLFENVSREDEGVLTDALKKMNTVLVKMELNDA